ncbi:diacylglycerol/lipid kinase family protein [Pseudolysinimonas sp.]|uniref:diacylglycerol/lipid kinase family protein n=1 Tax=Pseudolysinimonas sp. TaxID=2680009 RepID=UPI003F7DE6EC
MTLDEAIDARPHGAGPASPTGRAAAVVYNPVKVDLDALREVVDRIAARAGRSETLWFATTVDDPGRGPAQQAVDAGADLVIAAGGDGTIREVAEVVAGSSAALGLLPSGTGNLLARNLDLTLDDAEHAVTAAFEGEDRRIDLARARIRRPDGSEETRAFLVMAGVGLDADMLSSTDEELKARFGWVAYARALVTTLRHSNRINMWYRVDGGRPRRVYAHTAIVGNCGTLTANVLLLPTAAVDDGILDAVFIKPSNLRGWLQAFRKVLWQNGVLARIGGRRRTGSEVDAVNYVRASSLEVKLGAPERIELDGDPMGDAVGFVAEVEHGGLVVRVPREDG